MELSKKLARTCGIFFKMRHYVTPETLELLYYSLFYSFLSCGIAVWGLTHPSVLDSLFKVQKRVIRAISFKHRFTRTTPLFCKHKILKLHDIHSLKSLCFVYECSNNSITPVFDSILTSYKLSIATTPDKHVKEIYTNRCQHDTVWEKICQIAGGILWNNLSVE